MNEEIPAQIKGMDELLYRQRHSAAHIMAEAVLEVFPEAKYAIGPPIENGFYYDFELPRPLTPEDLEALDKLMRESIAADKAFVRGEASKDEARRIFADQPYKLELIDAIDAPDVGICKHGDFTDLCGYPHVESTGQVGAFKLMSVAGAYWRGDEHNQMLQRIYGVMFPTQEELDGYLHRLEEAEKRDHRKLGRELDLFFTDPIAPGSPFFLPKGATVYNLAVALIRDLYSRNGYQEVITPEIFSAELWKRSGHYDNYRDNMYFIQDDDQELGVKPMNCPGHCVMFASQVHSYRELPIRYADFGRLHRFERSGTLHGLTRVRSLVQDDAHVYCALDQVSDEILTWIEMMREAYRAFGLSEPRFTLSLRPDKRIGTDEAWDRAEAALRTALQSSGMAFEEVPGEGAFYGPKIDLFIEDVIGREWQLSTCQLDFNLPERFDLHYAAEDGTLQRPVMIHRAILGSVERFLGVLIEHLAGAFPVWLAPVQAKLIPIADRHNDYCNEVAAKLRAAGLRAEVDERSERMQAKIRDAQLHKVPYMLIAGDRDIEAGAVSVRTREGEDLGAIVVDDFIARLKAEAEAK
ncbi:MAG TPA: threonine--tRNA ligase [Dehalococcoidia bacterium]|nr:threonine--tRNA ligase [Dehalococcoidia bacterium]